jgi:hypothetical protein
MTEFSNEDKNGPLWDMSILFNLEFNMQDTNETLIQIFK